MPKSEMTSEAGCLRSSKSNDPSLARPNDCIGDELRGAGLRSTRPRRLVLALVRAAIDHPRTEEIRARLAAQGQSVNVTTVYQNLGRLVEAGLLLSFLDDNGRVRFDATVAPHHHLGCLGCGLILDAELDAHSNRSLRTLSRQVAASHCGWDLETAKLELRGHCPSCRGQKHKLEVPLR